MAFLDQLDHLLRHTGSLTRQEFTEALDRLREHHRKHHIIGEGTCIRCGVFTSYATPAVTHRVQGDRWLKRLSTSHLPPPTTTPSGEIRCGRFSWVAIRSYLCAPCRVEMEALLDTSRTSRQAELASWYAVRDAKLTRIADPAEVRQLCLFGPVLFTNLSAETAAQLAALSPQEFQLSTYWQLIRSWLIVKSAHTCEWCGKKTELGIYAQTKVVRGTEHNHLATFTVLCSACRSLIRFRLRRNVQ
jgi:hypothetical protein